MLRRVLGGLAASILGAGAVLAGQGYVASRRVPVVQAPAGLPGSFGASTNPPLRLVVIGDSTSVGIGASAIDKTYPFILGMHLGTRFRVSLEVVGRSGARMSDAASELAPKAAGLVPQVAVIGIGANDVTHATPLKTFARHLSSAIQTLRASDAEVLVALGPRFDTPAIPQPLRTLIRARARAINRTIRKVAAKEGVEVLDLPAVLGDSFARDHDLYSQDRFHPGDRGYALWADVMKDKVMNAAMAKAEKR